MVNFVPHTPRVASIHLSSTMKATTSTASRALPRECFLNLSSSRCDACLISGAGTGRASWRLRLRSWGQWGAFCTGSVLEGAAEPGAVEKLGVKLGRPVSKSGLVGVQGLQILRHLEFGL